VLRASAFRIRRSIRFLAAALAPGPPQGVKNRGA
jgi:hypothetical protein